MTSRRTQLRRGRIVTTVLALGVAHLAAALALTWGTAGAWADVRAPGPAPAAGVLALGSAVVAWAVFGWLAAGCLAAVLASSVPGFASSRLADLAATLTPSITRRLVQLLLGASLLSAPFAGTATANTAAADSPRFVAAVSAADPRPNSALGGIDPAHAVPSLRPGWTPDRPASGKAAVADRDHPARTEVLRLAASAPHAERAAIDVVAVRRGDSLWSVAAAHLGPEATAADIAVEWPRWFAANRSVIGPDPGLIRPGQLLRPPPA